MTFNNNPQMRAVPCNVPAKAIVKVYPAEFYDQRRGITREQWQAIYRPADARDLRDLVKVVVNFYHSDEPKAGDTWEVKMLSRALKTEIIFANALRRIEPDPAPAAVMMVEVAEVEEHQLAKRTIWVWMAELPSKLKQLVDRFQKN